MLVGADEGSSNWIVVAGGIVLIEIVNVVVVIFLFTQLLILIGKRSLEAWFGCSAAIFGSKKPRHLSSLFVFFSEGKFRTLKEIKFENFGVNISRQEERRKKKGVV